MRRFNWAPVLGFCLAIGVPAAHAFDCAKAYLPVDFVICSEPAVIRANEGHEKAWYDARARLNDAEKQQLLADQRRWLKEYPPRCGVPAQGTRPPAISRDQQLCVESALKERKVFLEQYRSRTSQAQSSPQVGAQPPAHPTPVEDRIGPSFDCRATQQPFAQVICGDLDLSVTDLRFTQAYFALLRQLDDAGKRELKQEDIRFIDAVQQHCGIHSTGTGLAQSDALRKCVKDAYDSQRSVWLLRLRPPLSEEANRPVGRHIDLQRSLQKLGFLPAEAVIDGVYGGATREAISQWQRSQSREVTGVLGDDDARVLEQEVSKAGRSTIATEERPGQGPLAMGAPQKPPTRMDTPDRANSTLAPEAQSKRPGMENIADNPSASSLTSVSDCRIVAPVPVPYINNTPYRDVTATWRGSCIAGLADGIGTATWYSRGIQFLVEEFSSNNGAVMKAGRPVASDMVNQSIVDWKLLNCDKVISYRYIEGQVSETLDLSKEVVVNKLLELAEQVAWRLCPAKLRSNVNVLLSQNGQKVVTARSVQNSFAEGGRLEYGNSALQAKTTAAVIAWDQENNRRAMVAQQAAEQAARQQATQRAHLSHERFDNFAKRNGVVTWPSLDQLRANPFVYEGKTIGLVSSFDQMIGRDRGIFAGGVLVSSIPTDAFQSRIQILLAGQVEGNELMETPFGGKVPLPHLKFVGFYKCEQDNCEDALFWQHQH